MAHGVMPGKKKKRRLRVFEVTTRVDLDENRRQQYAINEATNEMYMLKPQCEHCSSTTTTSSVEEGTTPEHPVGPGWLRESDYDDIIDIRDREISHQRRSMCEKQEVTTRRVKNKLNLLDTLRIYTTTQETCQRLISEAVAADKVSVNLNAFLIMEDDSLRPYNLDQGGCHYELVHNKHADESISKQKLFEAMWRHQESAFKQLIHIFRYLEELSPPREYLIYRKKIELIGDSLVDRLDFWDKVELLFEPKREGYYYAIIVPLGFSLGLSVTETTKTHVATRTVSKPHWV